MKTIRFSSDLEVNKNGQVSIDQDFFTLSIGNMSILLKDVRSWMKRFVASSSTI